MFVSVPRRVVAALLTGGFVMACASARGSMPPGPEPAPMPTSTRPDPAAIARAQADSVRYPYTEADVQFMSGMIPHHAQAVVMAEWALTRAAHPSVRTLAGRIITAQRDEIALMQQWLRDRRQPVPEVSPTGEMTGHGAHHSTRMPGMLTEQQMQQLEQARGEEFDRLFVMYMIRHHQGAVTMVKELFGTPGAGQDETVFKFASDVNVDQTTEIERMKRMLVDLIFEKP